MTLIDIISFIIMLALLYEAACFLFRVVRFVLVWVWSVIGWTYTARFNRRMNRIVKRTKAEQQALAKIYLSNMEAITDEAAQELLRKE